MKKKDASEHEKNMQVNMKKDASKHEKRCK